MASPSSAKDTGKKTRFPLYSAIALTLILPLFYALGFFSHAEGSWQDQLFRMRGTALKAGDSRIIMAALDDDTLKRFGFPPPRSLYARLFDKARTYGVKTILIDVLFIDKSPYDREVVAATRRFGHVVNAFNINEVKDPRGNLWQPVLPIKGLKEASQYLGYVSVDQFMDSEGDIRRLIDDDGHIRRVALFNTSVQNPKDPAEIAPSVDAAAIASFLGEPLSKVKDHYGARELLRNFRRPATWNLHEYASQHSSLKTDNGVIPLFDSPYRRISIVDLLDGKLTKAQKTALKGSILIAASTAIGYYDHYPDPFSTAAPGGEVHANNIDNALQNDFLHPLPRVWTLLAILAAIWLPFFLLRATPYLASGAAALAFVAWYVFAYWSFTRGVRVDFIAPLFSLVSSFLVQMAYRVITEGAEKRFIKNLFGQFVAPEVVNELARDPSKIKLGGEKKDLTILFLDIAHFTSISEKMDPEALLQFLNKYLSTLSAIVHEHNGVVDKYIGDCIMAFWNAPIETPDHRAQACLTAVECQAAARRLGVEVAAQFPEPPSIRIGLNSGTATVGLTGSEKKLQYTVIGDEVNLASRLEGANKFFGSKIMVSEAAYSGAKEMVEARELGRVRVVGKDIPIRVFEPLGRKGALSAEWEKALKEYNQGLSLFGQRKFKEAKGHFEAVLKLIPQDGPADLYAKLCRDYGALPPPADWDGTFNLTAK